MISDQSARDRITFDHQTLLAVDAGAGTVNTTLLVSRLISLLVEKKSTLGKIAAITFTEKAAAELVERLRSKLGEELLNPRSPRAPILQALQDLEKAPISTIHSFCASLLRDYPVEAGVDPRFMVLDEVQSGAFETRIWENWLKKTLRQPVEPLFHFLRVGGTFEHLEELKKFLKLNHSLLIPTAPQTLPKGIEFKKKLEHFMSQTRKLATGCKDNEDGLMNALQQTWKDCSFLETASTDEMIFELANLEIPKTAKKGNQKNWNKELLEQVRQEFLRLAEEHEAFSAQLKNAVLLNIIYWLLDYLKEYENQKLQQGFLDFDDLLLKTRNLLKNHTESRAELKQRLHYLFVDEFQDTDPLQVEIVFFLSEKRGHCERDWRKVQLEPGKLFLVGDPKQSIYRFRRADVEIYEQTKKLLEANGGKVELLTENFRTVGSLIDWVNGSFPSLFDQTLINYKAQSPHRNEERPSNAIPFLLGIPIHLPQGEKVNKDLLRRQEAEGVASFIHRKLLNGDWILSDPRTHQFRKVQPGDIAVLFRDLSNDNEQYWEESFRQRNLSYQIVGGKRFYNRPEIVTLSTLLSCLCAPADEAACVAVLRSSLFGFSDEAIFLHQSSGEAFHFLKKTQGKIEEAFALLRMLYETTRVLSVSETLEELLKQTNLLSLVAAQPHGEQRVANLLKVVDQARDLETSQNFTYRAFTQWLNTQQEDETMEGEAPGPDSIENRITLMTIHKAKGLEFPVVFISGVASQSRDSSSMLDRKHSMGAFKVGKNDLGLKTSNYEEVQREEKIQREAENSRLLYVAATRAQESLVLPFFQLKEETHIKTEKLFLAPLLEGLDTSPITGWREFNTGGKIWIQQPDTQSECVEDPPALIVDLEKQLLQSEPVKAELENILKLHQSKEKIIQMLRGSNEFQSVTSLLGVDGKNKNRQDMIMEEIEEFIPSSGGKSFGNLVHLLLEKGWDWTPEMISKGAFFYASELGLHSPEVHQAVQLVEAALKSDLLQRARKAEKIFRELTLTGTLEKGIFINAVIDLAFLEKGQWVIVDYKTDQNLEKGKEKYQEQLGYYRKLLEKFTPFKVKEAFLYSVRHSDVERLSF